MPRSAAATPAVDRALWDIVDAGLEAIGVELDAGARSAIESQVRLLLAWNEHVNLSGLRSVEQIARGHVLDSLIAVPFLRRLAGERPTLLDLGSGAGYPGLPLAVALPASRAALVDSIAKKAAFLAVVAEEAASVDGGTSAEVVALAERAEDLADDPEHRETWDLVTARAVGSVAEVAETGLPLTKRGGHVAIWKFADARGDLGAELDAAERISGACGGGRPRVIHLPVAEGVGLPGHCLVLIDKRRPTPERFPRQPGERRRRPLP
ncbi:MAG: 16S rRNA (guanine(527)-N(7))-methyltransferase RsmG [Chloroflexota bacterium]